MISFIIQDDCKLSYEEQLEIATKISLEEAQQKQAERDSKQKQVEEDYLFAQRLHEKENRLMQAGQYKDYSRKARRQQEEMEDEDHDFGRGGSLKRNGSRYADATSLHEDDTGDDELNFGTGWGRRLEGDTPLRRRFFRQEDDNCWSPKSKGNRRDFSSAEEFSDDDSDDCHWPSSGNSLYTGARRQLRGESEDDCYDNGGGFICHNAHLECPRNNYDKDRAPVRNREENYANHRTNRNENRRQADSEAYGHRRGCEGRGISEEAREGSLYKIGTRGMLSRAELTYNEVRAKRNKLRKRKEQESLDMALALSRSV